MKRIMRGCDKPVWFTCSAEPDQAGRALAQVTWTQGATQGGSSGAALIDAGSGRIVGVLTGGTTTCDVFSGADYFGKLSVVRRMQHNPSRP